VIIVIIITIFLCSDYVVMIVIIMIFWCFDYVLMIMIIMIFQYFDYVVMVMKIMIIFRCSDYVVMVMIICRGRKMLLNTRKAELFTFLEKEHKVNYQTRRALSKYMKQCPF